MSGVGVVAKRLKRVRLYPRGKRSLDCCVRLRNKNGLSVSFKIKAYFSFYLPYRLAEYFLVIVHNNSFDNFEFVLLKLFDLFKVHLSHDF
jgi:hypothetical protein